MNPHRLNSAIYATTVVHHRRTPDHHFAHRVPYLYIDLAEIEHLQRHLWLFGTRHRPVTLRAADHFDGTIPLADAVRNELANAHHPDADRPDLHIGVLTQPRVLGYAFNPISFWWVRRGDGTTTAVCAEINNTFGERMTQVLSGGDAPRLHDDKAKQFHVSPFLGLDLAYHYHYPAVPEERIRIGIEACDTHGAMLTATLTGHRHPLTDRGLASLIADLPPQRTMWRIHAQALRLWQRHAPFRHKPPFVPGIGSVTEDAPKEAA